MRGCARREFKRVAGEVMRVYERSERRYSPCERAAVRAAKPSHRASPYLVSDRASGQYAAQALATRPRLCTMYVAGALVWVRASQKGMAGWIWG